jgi:hypothetical protein
VKYLREYDRDLGIRWNRDRNLWQVTWNGKDAWAVCESDGSYRQLDERVVTQAKLNDLWTYKSAAEYTRIQQEERHRIEGMGKRKWKDDVRQEALEDGYQQVFGVGQFTGWGAGARA